MNMNQQLIIISELSHNSAVHTCIYNNCGLMNSLPFVTLSLLFLLARSSSIASLARFWTVAFLITLNSSSICSTQGQCYIHAMLFHHTTMRSRTYIAARPTRRYTVCSHPTPALIHTVIMYINCINNSTT